jgi:hypothetical protein
MTTDMKKRLAIANLSKLVVESNNKKDVNYNRLRCVFTHKTIIEDFESEEKLIKIIKKDIGLKCNFVHLSPVPKFSSRKVTDSLWQAQDKCGNHYEILIEIYERIEGE